MTSAENAEAERDKAHAEAAALREALQAEAELRCQLCRDTSQKSDYHKIYEREPRLAANGEWFHATPEGLTGHRCAALHTTRVALATNAGAALLERLKRAAAAREALPPEIAREASEFLLYPGTPNGKQYKQALNRYADALEGK